jgi:glycerol-3-phosphate dehydrogenase (NAD(P)+)
MKQKKILMIGQGAFATSISNVLGMNGHLVIMLCQENIIANEINEKKTNHRYYQEPNKLNNIVGITIQELKNHSYDLIFQAIPIPFLEKILLECKPYINQKVPWVSLSKGINNHGLTGSALIGEIIKPDYVYVLSGPSFAEYINKHDYTGMILAGVNHNWQQYISETVSNEFLKVYASEDIHGLELVAAAKNILAIFIGLLETLSYHDNARALFFTKSIEQLNTVIIKLGGKQETIFGLGGIGDLFLTCSGNASKNKSFGKTLGSHTFIKQDFFLDKDYMCEGIETTKTFKNLLNKYRLTLSIFESLYAIIYQEAPIQKTIHQLFQSF